MLYDLVMLKHPERQQCPEISGEKRGSRIWNDDVGIRSLH